MTATAKKALELYQGVVEREFVYIDPESEDTIWAEALRRIETEWELLELAAVSAVDALMDDEEEYGL